ncbi:MAG: hypothetical protein HZC17_10200 [Candidatus Omnitrophica bacterium]|nr:hypothetical protein [Candidatus Omnitrophota bacterium]
MQIQFIQAEEKNDIALGAILEPVFKKIFPEYKPLHLPSWLLANEPTLAFEKEGAIILVVLWPSADSKEQVYHLLETKAKWEQFSRTFAKDCQVNLAVFGEKIPDAVVKILRIEEGARAFELFFIPEDNKVFVKDLIARRKDMIPEVKYQSENVLKQDTSLTSFFYKMGKLSEEEISKFLELESDLNQMGL